MEFQDARRHATWLWWSKPLKGIILIGIGEFTTHFRTYFSGDWDVHWGYGLLLVTHGHMPPTQQSIASAEVWLSFGTPTPWAAGPHLPPVTIAIPRKQSWYGCPKSLQGNKEHPALTS